MITEKEAINRIHGLTVRSLRIWVKQGWLSPPRGPSGYVFEEIDIARLHLIKQLKTDLAVNNDAVPVVLSLIDQIHGLRHELKSLAHAIESQHEDIQHAIVSTLGGKRLDKDEEM